MLLNIKEKASQTKDKLIPLAKNIYQKKKDCTIQDKDYKDFENNLEALCKEVLLGHKEVFNIALLTSKISSNTNEIKYFMENHSLEEIYNHLVSLSDESY